MATPQESLILNRNQIYPLAGLNILYGNPVAATPTTLLPDQYLIEVDTSALAITLNLPATPYKGEEHQVVDNMGNANAHNITVSGNGNTINGAASVLINTSFSGNTFRFNGLQWLIVAKV